MDIDPIAPGLKRLVDENPPLDRVAYGLIFGEGPVWDRTRCCMHSEMRIWQVFT